MANMILLWNAIVDKSSYLFKHFTVFVCCLTAAVRPDSNIYFTSLRLVQKQQSAPLGIGEIIEKRIWIRF